jgi:hypothetical protein
MHEVTDSKQNLESDQYLLFAGGNSFAMGSAPKQFKAEATLS